MQNLPNAEVYEKEFQYMPWGILIHEILEFTQALPQNARIVDLMCGPGYLLGKINETRPDLQLIGVDLEKEFIDFAKTKYANINFIHADASLWEPEEKFDLVLVTAGLHHLPHEQQEAFIEKVSGLINPKGKVIIADPYIDDYSNEQERKLASAKLGYEYLIATIKSGGGNDVIKAAVDVMTNDLFLIEWKTSIKKAVPLFERYFTTIEMHKTWPQYESEYGDYYFVLSNK